MKRAHLPPAAGRDTPKRVKPGTRRPADGVRAAARGASRACEPAARARRRAAAASMPAKGLPDSHRSPRLVRHSSVHPAVVPGLVRGTHLHQRATGLFQDCIPPAAGAAFLIGKTSTAARTWVPGTGPGTTALVWSEGETSRREMRECCGAKGGGAAVTGEDGPRHPPAHARLAGSQTEAGDNDA